MYSESIVDSKILNNVGSWHQVIFATQNKL